MKGFAKLQILAHMFLGSAAGCALRALGGRCRPSPEETQHLLTRARTDLRSSREAEPFVFWKSYFITVLP